MKKAKPLNVQLEELLNARKEPIEILTDEDGPLQLLQQDEYMEKRILELEVFLLRKSKSELAKQLASLLLVQELDSQMEKFYAKELEFFRGYFLDSQIGRVKNNNNKQKGKEKTYKNNNDCLEHCYKAFSENLEAPVRPIDYPAYKRFLLKLYPHPPFIPEARLTGKERQQSKQIQNEDRDLKTRHTWSDPTVRAAFRKFSGVRPTTLKK